ncbi:hypothetical protein NDU88_003119 [Pleurodeles waltl]|uniref:Uncharacterized protein n=1 Tax=Pleurodeles waltl TaxID=8319 RepID=A0AAV7VEG9_PLEWA|nr:hypothetical protein NDU88_003119 [Pleurodeles waltl]
MDVPATLKTESGTESRFSYPSDALSGHHDNTDAACLAGNPDIRVPEALKVDDGLHAGRVAAEGDAGGEKEKEKGGPEKSGRHPTTEELRESAVQDLAETGDVSEGCELRHVPGGTWLDQASSIRGTYPRSCLPCRQRAGTRSAHFKRGIKADCFRVVTASLHRNGKRT